MVTAREYFDKHTTLMMRTSRTESGSVGGEPFEAIVGITLDFESNAKAVVAYIPEMKNAPKVAAHYVQRTTEISSSFDGISITMGMAESDEAIESDDLLFAKRLTIYTPFVFSADQKSTLHALASQLGLSLVIRDGSYTAARAKGEIPAAFISHDSRDKDALVRELARELSKLHCHVWYDEYALVAGDSLRERIEAGLKTCERCVLVLSQNFLSNGGWTKAEFDSIFTRELLEQRNVIIPIWLGVTKQQVYDYSPRLADKVAIQGELGPAEVARRVYLAINRRT